MRTRLLAACLTLSLTACEGQGPAPQREPADHDVAVLSTQDIRAALQALPEAEVLGTHEDGVPYMIRGKLGTAGRSLRGVSARDAHEQLGAALAGIVPVFRLRASNLVVQRLTRDEQGHTHIRYAQMRNGLLVVGHELVLHVDADGRVYAANGSARDGENVPAPDQARVTADAARALARAATAGHRGAPRG